MKNLIWIGALVIVIALALVFLNKDEPQAPAPAETDVIEATADEQADEAIAEEEAVEEEVLEVVEESAAEAEPTDEAIVLAMEDSPAPPREWQFTEGQHYVRLVPAQPITGSADKIEVAEIFWYGCPHCYDMEPFINEWAKNKDPGVRFVRIPATWNDLVRLHAQLYYTEETLARNGILTEPEAFREAVFIEYHRRGNRMTSVDSIRRIFERFGVTAEQFNNTWNSFEVNQKLRVAADLARRYNISSVPAVVVNGKYRTSAAEAGSYPKLMELIDELTVREGLR